MAAKILIGGGNQPYVQNGAVWLYDSAVAAWPTTLAMFHDCTVSNAPYYTSVAQLSAGPLTVTNTSLSYKLDGKDFFRYVNYSGTVSGCSITMWVAISSARGLYWHLQFKAFDYGYNLTRVFAKRITALDATPWGTSTEVISTSGGPQYGGYTAPTYITLTA